MPQSVPQQTVMFEGLFRKSVQVEFSEPDLSSSGGLLLLKQLDESLGLTRALAECLTDSRQAGKVEFDLLTLIQQRVFGICCGYEDANDVARYRDDGMMKLACDRDPTDSSSVSSQSTLSRFENQVTAPELYRMSEMLFDLVASRHRKRLGRRLERVIIDLDATVNYTHGQQQLTMFNKFYDGHCYLPLMGFLSFNDEPEQYACATVLRSGSPGSSGDIPTLMRLIARTRCHFPSAEIVVRLDNGFASPELFDLLDQYGVKYLVGFAKNSVLSDYSSDALSKARAAFRRSGDTIPFYGSTWGYKAKSWGKSRRRTLYKAEVVSHEGREPRDNVRYVVTNMKGRARDLYRLYVGRGDCENRIKEAKLGLRSDRMSCPRFLANQFRALLSTAALVLFQELRIRARRTPAATWQVERIRLFLIQIGARVSASVRRIRIRLPRSHPWSDLWLRLAAACCR